MKSRVISMLTESYGMELETVQNYLAASVNLDGVRSDVVKKSLAADIPAELGQATLLANRIKTLGGVVPGSLELKGNQTFLQAPVDSTDIIAIIKGVIKAEDGAIAQYNKIIEACEGKDYVTQDFAIQLLGD